MSDWLVIGSGQLANGMMRYLPQALHMRRPDHDLREIVTVPQTTNGTAIICAAVTGIRQCEMFPDWSRDVNVNHTYRVAALLNASGWNVVMLSSQAADRPTTEYGRQKADLEARWRFGPILRLPKILDRDNPLLWSWKHELSNQRVIRPFSDVIIQPIRVVDAVDAVKAVSGLRGLIFDAPGPRTTWAEVAWDIARATGLDTSLVQPQTGGIAYSVMDDATIRNTGWRPPKYRIIIDSLI